MILIASVLSMFLEMEPKNKICREVHEVLAEAVDEGWYSPVDAFKVVYRCEQFDW